ncbi:MAG: transcriptional repressor NrdR [Bdellovibrionales bacterium]|nr:transcriptional repressor NrdR [Bdellovibrionales bacterium]
MKCPKCGSAELSVVDSRGDDNAIRRRRVCQSCSFRFTTYERIERALPMVVKKDNTRQTFDREKIHSGLVKAFEKRPVSMETIDQIADAVEQRISELCLKEIPSRQIGDFLMDAIKGVDKIAYVRFASVYREFSDVSEFAKTLKSLSKPEKKRVSSPAIVAENLARQGR